jgi:kynurenine formamidase
MIHGSPARFDIISASMARVPRFLDVSVPLAPGIPTCPGNPPFELDPVKRIANGDVEPGMYELYCLPLRIAGADGAPARVVLKR